MMEYSTDLNFLKKSCTNSQLNRIESCIEAYSYLTILEWTVSKYAVMIIVKETDSHCLRSYIIGKRGKVTIS